MCDGYWSTSLYLISEKRHHTAGRSQDISKTDSNESGIRSSIQILAKDFRHSLCGTHDIRRIHSLVGRNEHKFRAPVAIRGFCHNARTQHIVSHRLAHLMLEHGNVLVGSRMKYHLWTITRKDLFNCTRIAYIA